MNAREYWTCVACVACGAGEGENCRPGCTVGQNCGTEPRCGGCWTCLQMQHACEDCGAGIGETCRPDCTGLVSALNEIDDAATFRVTSEQLPAYAYETTDQEDAEDRALLVAAITGRTAHVTEAPRTAQVRVSLNTIKHIRLGVFQGFCERDPDCIAQVDHEGPCQLKGRPAEPGSYLFPTADSPSVLAAHNEQGATVLDCTLCRSGEPMIHSYEPPTDAP